MKRIWRFVKSSLRFRLVFLVLMAALPVLAIIIYTGWQQREGVLEDARQNALQLVQFAAARHEVVIEDTRVFLVALSHSLDPSDVSFDGCGHLFTHLKQVHFPFYSAFYVADLEANILCTMPDGDLPEDLEGCHHYQSLIGARDFVVSEYHICRNTGKGVISMGYPVYNNEDVQVGVINISIDLKWFNDFAQQADIPPKSSLEVFDKSGTILSHFPNPEYWVGKSILEGSVEESILRLKNGTLSGYGADNVERLYAFMPLSGSEDSVFISLGIPVDYAFAEVNHTLTRNLVLVGSLTVLLLVSAWFLGDWVVMRPIKVLVDTTQKLAAGDLSVRVDSDYDSGEFAVLVNSIDEMAEALSQREAEREAAASAIQAYAEDLERSNRDLLDFANIASHDLQEPLRKIATFSDMLHIRYGDSLDERARDYLERIQASAKRMQGFIIALLSYSRLSTQVKAKEIVDLNEVVRNVLNDLDIQIEQSKAEIQVSKLPLVKADQVQMHQLFLNLINNSLKFRKPESPVKIEVLGKTVVGARSEQMGISFDSGYFEISFSDNGIGFDEKYLDRMYQPFQRLHRFDKYEGTGMGLAICRKIIERHDGEIEAHSSPGKGATFIVRLPIINSSGGEA